MVKNKPIIVSDPNCNIDFCRNNFRKDRPKSYALADENLKNLANCQYYLNKALTF